MDFQQMRENPYILLPVMGLLLFWLVYLYFVKNYGYWEVLHVPHVPGVFPWGSLRDGLVFSKVNIAISYDEFYKQFRGERFYGIMQVRSPCLVIRDPDLIQNILTVHSEYFQDRTVVEHSPNEYMMKFLFNMRADEWRVMRKKLAPAYNCAKMKMVLCHLKNSSAFLKDQVEEMITKSIDVDTEDLVHSFVLESVIKCAFGDTTTHHAEINQLKKIVPLIFQWNLSIFQKLLIYNAFPIFKIKTFHLKKFEMMKPQFKEIITNLVYALVTYREQNNDLGYGFLDLLIKIRQNKMWLEEGHQSNRPGKVNCLTNKQIAGEVFGFIAGTYQKLSSVMIFSLYQLSCNSQVQERLHHEINEIMSKCNGVISLEAIEQMTYMDSVLSETLRMYPALPFIQRACNRNYRVPNSDLIIQPEVQIIVPTLSLHHDPDYYPKPDKFDPDRFTGEKIALRHPFVFLPFGAGPRCCMGMTFGLSQVKAGLATIVQDFEIRLSPNTTVPIQIKGKTCTLQTEHPIKLLLRRRQLNKP